MYGGMCTASFTESMLNLMAICIQSGVQLTYAFISNESLITRARNTLANIFLRDTTCSHLMFIDSDIGFNAHDVIRIMLHDKDIVCGVYTKKEINWKSVKKAAISGVHEDELKHRGGSLAINLVDFNKEVNVKDNDVAEVMHGATGFMMIKRDVMIGVSGVSNKYLSPKAPLGADLNVPGNFDYEFFACSIQDGTGLYLSEDYHFCEVARRNGYKVFVDPSVKLTHTGTYVYEGGFIFKPNE